MNSNKLTSFALLFILLLCTALLIFPGTGDINSPQQVKSPDWYMTNVTINKYNAKGKMTGQLISPRLDHFAHGDYTNMQTPFFKVHDDNGSIWHINSVYGRAYHGQHDKVDLWQHVVLQQMPGKGSDNTKLLTKQLTYYPNKRFAHTDQPVTITEPGSILHSVGFNADLQKGYIQFLSRTKAEYKNVSKNPNNAINQPKKPNTKQQSKNTQKLGTVKP